MKKLLFLSFIFIATAMPAQNPNKTVFKVDSEYWEGCETGKGDCKPLKVIRKSSKDSVLFIMPCGGTETSVTLYSKDKLLQTVHIFHDQCPPKFDLTGLPDGRYSASMLACGLGGTIQFDLITK